MSCLVTRATSWSMPPPTILSLRLIASSRCTHARCIRSRAPKAVNCSGGVCCRLVSVSGYGIGTRRRQRSPFVRASIRPR
uniref:Putative secreted protein n=1 Tax=Anopheles triannulatus TaxID=58253 RepID=A0A2M4B387_9DIPT